MSDSKSQYQAASEMCLIYVFAQYPQLLEVWGTWPEAGNRLAVRVHAGWTHSLNEFYICTDSNRDSQYIPSQFMPSPIGYNRSPFILMKTQASLSLICPLFTMTLHRSCHLWRQSS